jgi:hypothetical protein
MKIDRFYYTGDVLKVNGHDVGLSSIGNMICTPQGAFLYQAFIAQWLAESFGKDVERPSLTEWLQTAPESTKQHFWKDEPYRTKGASVRLV